MYYCNTVNDHHQSCSCCRQINANAPQQRQQKWPFQCGSLFPASSYWLFLYSLVKLQEHPNFPGVMQSEDEAFPPCVPAEIAVWGLGCSLLSYLLSSSGHIRGKQLIIILKLHYCEYPSLMRWRKKKVTPTNSRKDFAECRKDGPSCIWLAVSIFGRERSTTC